MKLRYYLGLLGTAAGGFAIGRISATSPLAPAPGPEASIHQSPLKSEASAEHVTEAAAATRRKERSGERSPSREPRVSVPLASISAILKESQFSYCDFNDINRKMPDALIMLGASPKEKEAALAVMTGVHDAMIAAEKDHLKVSKSDSSGVTLDMTGMAEPSLQIAEKARQGLRDTLPADVAETLIGSIDWNRFYFQGTSTETSFKISRNANGSLSATTVTGSRSHGSGLKPEEYPDDGTPIPAEAVFDKRWAPFLEDALLLPVNR